MALEVAGLVKRYGRRTVLSLDFRLGSGDFCVVLGENGAGKSTLFRCLLGLELFEGTVRVSGQEARGRVAGVLDEPMAYPSWTIARFIRYALNDSQALRRPVIERLVDTELLGRRVGRLSTGQRKLALLATLLAGDAEVVLLDEFAHGLDQEARRRFRDVVRDELARGRSFIATGHDLAAFGELPSRLVVLQQGRLIDVSDDDRARKDISQIYDTHFPRTDA